ncbi:TetR/AcrR family transcriptional regulator [Natronohydrobacter thiooxidans]|jgi:AcrR family transcriptional regulator|uniref:TetR/AcrR family transcriptional regulator n=1 Tax=Natronohydrobacter thiooxidans TaxID=87172 RepID=UPI0008FF412D|nr:TetR/AcrR family transcriptional regulator [Natronohydrobacter thiooxidans]
MTVQSPRHRRSQEERSQDTQQRILRGALACITRNGLQRTSTHDIAREAKVSRGALLHHYPTRAALLEAAFSLLLEEEAKLIEEFSEDLSRDGSSVALLVKFIRERYAGALFSVTLDYLSLARVDDETMSAVTPGASRYIETLNRLWDRCLSEVSIPAEQKRNLMNQTMLLIRGMSFQAIWRQDPAYFDKELDAWIRELETHFRGG